MVTTYTLTCDQSLLVSKIASLLKNKHSSTLYLDKTCCIEGLSVFRVDTYQVLNLYWGGYITINVYSVRPDMTKDDLQVKVSIFSSYWKSPTSLMKRLQKEIHEVIVAHGGNAQEEET